MKRVSAIVAAYNEAPRIGRVLEILTSYPGFFEVIVVDDGSTDGTADIARGWGVRVVRIGRNLGKGAAMERGVKAACGSVLFFCDADIIGLTHDIVTAILSPVLRGKKDMCIAARASKVRHLGFGFYYTPLLDGQRALTRALWNKVPARFKQRFEIESALNHFARDSKRGLDYLLYDQISHVKKEEKRGFIRGRLARIAMYRDVVATRTRLNMS